MRLVEHLCRSFAGGDRKVQSDDSKSEDVK